MTGITSSGSKVAAAAVAIGIGTALAMPGVATADAGDAGSAARTASTEHSSKGSVAAQGKSKAGLAKAAGAQGATGAIAKRALGPSQAAAPVPSRLRSSAVADPSESDTGSAPNVTDVTPVALTAPRLSVPVTAASPRLTTPATAAPHDVLTDVTSALQSLFSGGGTGPDFSDVLSSLVLAVRREFDTIRTTFENVLINKAPVVQPIEVIANTTTGVVMGTFDATDANGDRLVYRITDQPDLGTVAIDAKTGTWVYTPKDPSTTQDLVDSFTVSIDDVGFHLFDSVAPLAQTVSVSVPQVTPPDSASPSGSVTRGFDITNMTASAVTLTGLTVKEGKFDNAPAVGTVIAAGDRLHFELTYYALAFTEVNAQFATPAGVTYDTWMRINNISTTASKCTSDGGSCLPGVRSYLDNPDGYFGGTDIVLMDKAGSTIDLTDDPAAQTALLNKFCDKSGVSCTYDIQSRDTTLYTPWVQQDFQINTSPVNQPLPEKTYTTDVTTENGFEISASAKGTIAKIVETTITAKYNFKATQKYTFSVKVSGVAASGGTTVVWTRAPIIRYTGTLTVRYGNTTYVIHNAVVDVPDIKLVDNAPVSIDGRSAQRYFQFTETGQTPGPLPE